MEPSHELLLPSQLLAAYQSSWLWLRFICVAVLLILAAWGYAMLRLFPAMRLSEEPWPFACECLLNGFLVFCITALSGVLVGIQIVTTFWAVSACAGAVLLALRPRSFTRSSTTSQQTKLYSWTLLLVLLSSAVWSIDNLRGLLPADDGIVLSPWVDALLHARQIGDFAQFRGDFRVLNGNMYGASIAPYHYGSYMLPSLVSYLGDVPPIQLATTLFPTLGIFLTGISVLVLANAVGGPRAGLAAVTLLLLLPDAPFWIRDRDLLNSYSFLQQVGIGGSYATSIMGLALAHALRSFEDRSLARSFYALALFTTAGVLFKFQILLAYAWLFFLFVLWYAPWRHRHARWIAGASFVAVFLFLAYLLNRVPNAPTLSLSFDGVVTYIDKVLERLHIATASNVLRILLFPAAVVYLLSVIFGVLLPASLYLCWKFRADESMRSMIILCVTSVGAVAAIRLLLKNNEGLGDVAEINRKTMVWAYYVVATCTAILGTRYLRERLPRAMSKRIAIAIPLLLLGPLVAAANGLQGRWRYSDAFTNVRIPAGLFEISAHLRKLASRDEVVQLCENDDYNQLGTLSERPVYVSRIVVNAHGENAEERRRLAVVKNVLAQPDFRSAAAVLQENGIAWLVLTPSCRPPWEAGAEPLLVSRGYRLYRFL